MPLRYGLATVTAPANEPVELGEAKLHLRVTTDRENDLVSAKLKAARKHCEDWTGRAFVTQTLLAAYDRFPSAIWDGCEILEVPHPRLQSVTSIVYTDDAGDSQTLDADLYEVDAVSTPGRIAPVYGESWPVTRQALNAVQVTFVAGYGTPAEVPQSVKAAILLVLGHLYEHREQESEVALQSLDLGYQALLAGEWVGSYR